MARREAQILADVRQMKTSKLKTLLAHPGVHELLALHRADAWPAAAPTKRSPGT